MPGGADFPPARMAELWGAYGAAWARDVARAGKRLDAALVDRPAEALLGLADSLRRDAGRLAGASEVEVWEHAALTADLTGELAWGHAARLAAAGRSVEAKCCREVARAMSLYSRACVIAAGREETRQEGRSTTLAATQRRPTRG